MCRVTRLIFHEIEKPELDALWVVVTDIHANYQALTAIWKDAIKHAEQLGFTKENIQCISLGDVVDFGPQPSRCLAWVEERCTIKLRGNHDLECSFYPNVRPNLNRVSSKYWPITIWTRCQLTAEQRKTLQAWSVSTTADRQLPDIVMGHADLQSGTDQALRFEYKNSPWIYQHFFERLKRSGMQLGLIGHSHCQLLYWHSPTSTPDDCLRIPQEELMQADDRWFHWHESDDDLLLANPGAVGQPRALNEYNKIDWHAKYLLLGRQGSDIYLKFRRVNYDRESTARLLEKRVHLPNPLPNSREHPESLSTLLPHEICRLYREQENLVDQLIQCLGVNGTSTYEEL
jgi:hypothetical protein